jgi:hypothetical protein
MTDLFADRSNTFGGYVPADFLRYGFLDEDAILASNHWQSGLHGDDFPMEPVAASSSLQDPFGLYQPPRPALPSASGNDLYLVTVTDPSLANLAERLNQAGARVLRLGADTEQAVLVAQLSAQVAPGSLDRLHVISHGQSDQLQIGGSVIGSTNVIRSADWLHQIGSFLSQNGDILLYGCNLAADAGGQELVRRLADITGADVAASTNVTFEDAISRRSDWTLEDSVGPIGAGYKDLLTGLDWTGQLGGSASFNASDGILSISDASGSFSISGNLGTANTGFVALSGSLKRVIAITTALKSIEVSGQDFTINGINLDDPQTNEAPSAYAITLISQSSSTTPSDFGATIGTGITLSGTVKSFGGDITLTDTNTTEDLPILTWNPHRKGSIDLGTIDNPLTLSTLDASSTNAGALTISQEISVDPYLEYAGDDSGLSAFTNSFAIDKILNTALYGLQDILVPASVKVADLSGGINFDRAIIIAGSVAATSDVNLNLSSQSFVSNSASSVSYLTSILGKPFDIAAAVLVGSSDSSISLTGSSITTTSGKVALTSTSTNKLSSSAQVADNSSPFSVKGVTSVINPSGKKSGMAVGTFKYLKEVSRSATLLKRAATGSNTE